LDPVVRTTVEPETFEVPVTVMVAVDLTRMAEARTGGSLLKRRKLDSKHVLIYLYEALTWAWVR